ncbi:MAG: glycosyltransferase [Candidatus Bathyarchaeota archaeon]|nr:glycosyltransferase [Candidatus Bathyarchaeota archaeon]
MQLPPIKLDYLELMTDSTGVFQHAKYCIPKRNEGYTTDDNARALIVCTRYHRLQDDPRTVPLANVYLAFLNHMQKPEGNFHNYLSYERVYMDVDGSEDCLGRSLWACGCTINSILPRYMKLVAKEIFDKALPCVWKSTSLRLLAFSILGLSQYYRAYRVDDLKDSIERLANSLCETYNDQSKYDWRWFEPYLTYDNSRLPQALFEAYSITRNGRYLDVAKESTSFLLNTQMVDGNFMPIGNNGWYKRNGKRALYDQQPLEASAMVDTAVDAYFATHDESYLWVARTVFQWYLGKNSQKLMLYDPETAGCFDGITHNSVNMNQGAESSISYLLARLKLEELNIRAQGGEKPRDSSTALQINCFER